MIPRWTALLLIPALFLGLRLAVRAVPEAAVPWPAVLPDDRPRIVNAEGLTIPAEPWTLLIGGSSAYLGVEAPELPGVVLKQTLPGVTASDVAAMVRWDLEVASKSRLPERIIVGLHRASVMDRRVLSGDPCLTPVFVERADRDLERALRCNPRRGPDRLSFFTGRLDPWARRRSLLLQALAGGLHSAIGLERKAPRDYDIDNFGKEVSDAAQFRINLSRWAAMGTFSDPIDPLQERALAWIGAEAARYGVPVLGVAFPEHSLCRELYEPGVYQSFLAQLPGEVVDLSEALPDEGFYDQAHPNHKGRAGLTKRLGELISSHPGRSVVPQE